MAVWSSEAAAGFHDTELDGRPGVIDFESSILPLNVVSYVVSVSILRLSLLVPPGTAEVGG